MKITKLPFLLGALASAAVLTAAPFDADRVAGDTKWLAHLDVDGLKASSIGAFLLETAKTEMAKKNDSKVSVDLDGLLQQIHSITAYGTTFDDQPENNSVLVVETGPKAQAVIDGYLASQELANDGKVPFKTISGKSFPTYLFGNEVFVTFPRKDLIVVSKQFSQVENALSVIEGRTPKIAKGSSLLASSDNRGFFFVASANGFNTLKDMPPQARILQKATGIQIALGESGSNLATRITLATADAEVSSQMRRIVEGMLALVSFAQVEDQNLNKLAQSITVKETERAVSIGLTYPVEEVKKLLISLASNEGPARGQPKRPAPAIEAPATDSVGGERLKVANVDARSDNGNMARNATDDNPASYWGAVGRQQWIRCELDSLSLLREVQIAWTKGDERKTKFIVQTSQDGTLWTPVVTLTSTGEKDGLESYNVTDTTTRWVRVMIPGTSSNSLATISDLRFLGQANVSMSVGPEAAAVKSDK